MSVLLRRWLIGAGALGTATVAAVALMGPRPEPPAFADVATPEPAPAPAAAVDAPAEPPQDPAPTLKRSRSATKIDWTGDAALTEPPKDRDGEAVPGYRGQLVVGDALQPLTDARLQLTHLWLDTVLPRAGERERGALDRDLGDWQGTTNGLGHFEIPFAATGRQRFLLVDPDGPMADVLPLPTGVWPGATVELGTIRLAARGAITGHIRDDQQHPADVVVRAVHVPLGDGAADTKARERALRGADLDVKQPWIRGSQLRKPARWLRARAALLPFPETNTDSAGQFTLASVRPGNVRVVARRRDGVSVSRDVSVAPHRTTRIELAFPEEERAWLYLEDAGGLAVDARVMASDRPRGGAPAAAAAYQQETEDGRVLLARRVLEQHRVLVQRAAGWPWESYAVEPHPSEDDAFLVQVAPLGELIIHLLGIEGEAVATADVSIAPKPATLDTPAEPIASALQPTAHRPGTWRVQVPRGQSYRLLVRAEGYAPGLETIGVRIKDDTTPVEVRLFPTFALNVRVEDGSGAPVAKARIRVLPHHADLRHGIVRGAQWGGLTTSPILVGWTDADGVLRADGIWDNSVSFEASHPELGQATTRVWFPQPDADVRLRLRAASGLVGQLSDAGGPPAEDLVVRATATEWLAELYNQSAFLQPVETRVDPQGTFALHGLWPGTWWVEVRNANEPRPRPRALRTFPLLAGETRHFDWPLPELWVISGTVRIDGLIPGDDVTVVLRSRDENDSSAKSRTKQRKRRRPRRSWRPRQPFRRVTHIDPFGRFRIDGPDRDDMRLEVRRARDGREDVLAAHDIEAIRKTPDLDVRIRTGTTRVQILTTDGPLRHRELRATLRGSDPLLAFALVTDATGEAVLPALPDGNYELRIEQDPQRRVATCRVVAGHDRGAQVMLEAPR
ncbi:MAG: hypothetical protein AAF628_15705 [Planctomycetota bacterium]